MFFTGAVQCTIQELSIFEFSFPFLIVMLVLTGERILFDLVMSSILPTYLLMNMSRHFSSDILSLFIPKIFSPSYPFNDENIYAYPVLLRLREAFV